VIPVYNYGLATSGEIIKHHEQGHPQAAPDTQATITRHATLPITTYEIAIPAESLQSVTGSTRLQAGHQLGVGVAVNDGDWGLSGEDIGEAGQQGWSGWCPYTVVYGKNAEQAGMVTLGSSAPTACAPDSACEGVAGLAAKPLANEHCPATESCLDEFEDSSWTWVPYVLLIAAGYATYKYWPLIVTKIPAGVLEKLPAGAKGGMGGGGGGDDLAPAGGSIYGTHLLVLPLLRPRRLWLTQTLASC